MKRRDPRPGILLATLFVVPLAAATADQASVAAEVARVDKQIETIDQSLSDTAVRTKIFTRGSDSGVLTYYSSDGRFSKLVVQLVSEQSGDVAEYYYSNGTLIYAVEVCKNFSSSTHGGSIGSCKSISEDRFYLNDGELVEWLHGEGPGPIALRPAAVDTGELVMKLEQVVRSAQGWREFLRSPSTDFLKFQSGRNGS